MRFLACLASLGIITYKYNRAGVGRQQVNAYRRAAKQPDYLKADWVMALDMDEFLCLHAPLQTLDQWFGKLPEADQIFVNWAMFGNSGHTALTDDLVTSRFHLASVRESGAGKLRSFKTLFRREAFQRPGIHMPRGLPEEAGARRPSARSTDRDCPSRSSKERTTEAQTRRSAAMPRSTTISFAMRRALFSRLGKAARIRQTEVWTRITGSGATETGPLTPLWCSGPGKSRLK